MKYDSNCPYFGLSQVRTQTILFFFFASNKIILLQNKQNAHIWKAGS